MLIIRHPISCLSSVMRICYLLLSNILFYLVDLFIQVRNKRVKNVCKVLQDELERQAKCQEDRKKFLNEK